MVFNTSLLREKFLIKEKTDKQDTQLIEAVGNRLSLPLSHGTGASQENFIIRGKSMHCTTRMAASMAREFETGGPLLNRLNEQAWDNFWQDSQNSFDKISFEDNWISVFHDGTPIYARGKSHPFLSVMEQCDAKNRAEYDRAVKIAEDVFKQAGKIVAIDHETTIAMVAGLMNGMGRSGLILRMPGRNSTFTFHMGQDNQKTTSGKSVKPHHLLMMSADYMEALHLSVNIGIRQNNEQANTIDYLKKARTRMGRVNQSIQQFEKLFSFKYRPEKPDFLHIIKQSEDD